MTRRLRLASGLVLFSYVVTHLVNHSLGIVSLAAMEGMLGWVRPVWTSIPGTIAIYGAFVIHVSLAFFALWQRRTLKLQPLEALQYLLGFRRLLVRDLQGRDELWIVRRDAQDPDASSQEALDLDPRQFACPQGEDGEGLCRVDKWKTGAAFLAGLCA